MNPPPPRHQALFVAADGGARETLQPVSEAFSAAVEPVASGGASSEGHWSDRLIETRATVLVVGTSDSAGGRRIESAARRAARRARVPIAAIEDFPGNYDPVRGAAADLLIVESPAARELCIAKLGSAAPTVEVASPARYDRYREQLAALRAHTHAQWAQRAGAPRRVLWAGQPETGDCVRTLAALVPHLRALDAELLFKAHPRDAGHASGAYSRLLTDAGVVWSDVSAASVHDALAAAPELVVTQFSSVAINAGFHGIPSLWVLLPGAGLDRLVEKKGYAVPPACSAGAAAHADRAGALFRAFEAALTDSALRANLNAAFDVYFAVARPALPDTLQILLALAANAR
jgi:hypothetical protein